MMVSDEQQLSEVEALRKDWYERVYNTIEKLDGSVAVLSKEVSELKGDLKEYCNTGDEKLEKKLTTRIEALTTKLDADKLTEGIDNKKAKRHLQGLILLAAISVISAVGGYFITTAVNKYRITAVETSYQKILTWKEAREAGIIETENRSKRNEKDYYQLREEIRTNPDTKSDKEGP
jgi:hypothetical protein